MSYVWHPKTRDLLATLTKKLPSSVLITATPGVGAYTFAKQIAGKSLIAELHPTNSKDERDEYGQIRVKQIRELYTKTSGANSNTQIVIINQAERMNIQAQNAFLKLLEEPLETVHFILVAASKQSFLPTILSRVQSFSLMPVSEKQSIDLLKRLGCKEEQIPQVMFMAKGLPAEITRLLTDKSHFEERLSIMKDAKIFLAGSTLNKLIYVKEYSSSRVKTQQFIEAAAKILQSHIYSKPSVDIIDSLEKLETVHYAITQRQANVKIQLLRLVV